MIAYSISDSGLGNLILAMIRSLLMSVKYIPHTQKHPNNIQAYTLQKIGIEPSLFGSMPINAGIDIATRVMIPNIPSQK